MPDQRAFARCSSIRLQNFLGNIGEAGFALLSPPALWSPRAGGLVAGWEGQAKSH